MDTSARLGPCAHPIQYEETTPDGCGALMPKRSGMMPRGSCSHCRGTRPGKPDELVRERVGPQRKEQLENRRRRDGRSNVGEKVQDAERLSPAYLSGEEHRNSQAKCELHGTVRMAYQMVTRSESKTSPSPWDATRGSDRASPATEAARRASPPTRRPAAACPEEKGGNCDADDGGRKGEDRQRVRAEERLIVARSHEPAPREPPFEQADVKSEEEREYSKDCDDQG